MNPSDKPPDMVGGRYALLHKIGDGQMSTVFLGEDCRRENRHVAVKLLNSPHSTEFKDQFFRLETKSLERLDHPNIITIYDWGCVMTRVT